MLVKCDQMYLFIESGHAGDSAIWVACAKHTCDVLSILFVVWCYYVQLFKMEG